MPTLTLDDGPVTLPGASDVGGSNCGTPGVWRFGGAAPGPEVVLTVLVHGNEVCGVGAAWALVASQPQVPRGRLTVAFCNLQAYGRITDANKEECRLVDEDLNRVWGRLGSAPTESDTYELRRARELLPHVGAADVLLDLHSMSETAPALGLVGRAARNVGFARELGFPAWLVMDAGHAAGQRLIDSGGYQADESRRRAMLIECGQHFSRAACDAADEAVRRLVAVCLRGEKVSPAAPQTLLEVSEAVTIRTDRFQFVRDWGNMALVPEAGTLVARDGDREVRTPHEGTYMVMPATPRYCKPGLTGVRFARRVG